MTRIIKSHGEISGVNDNEKVKCFFHSLKKQEVHHTVIKNFLISRLKKIFLLYFLFISFNLLFRLTRISKDIVLEYYPRYFFVGTNTRTTLTLFLFNTLIATFKSANSSVSSSSTHCFRRFFNWKSFENEFICCNNCFFYIR